MVYTREVAEAFFCFRPPRARGFNMTMCATTTTFQRFSMGLLLLLLGVAVLCSFST